MRRVCKALWLIVLASIYILISAPNSAAQDLISASGAGDLNKVKALLSSNADVNARNARGSTALMLASYKGHLDVVEALINANADVNLKANDGITALMYAASSGR